MFLNESKKIQETKEIDINFYFINIDNEKIT